MIQAMAILILVAVGIVILRFLSPTGKATDAVKVGATVVGIGIGIVVFWGLVILVTGLILMAAFGAFN
jgi:hypothetical protein